MRVSFEIALFGYRLAFEFGKDEDEPEPDGRAPFFGFGRQRDRRAHDEAD